MDQSQREQELFKAALELGTPEERRAFLRGACGGEGELHQKVEGLLAAYFASQSYIPTAHVPGADACRKDAGPAEGPGTALGHYRLLQKIGEGGFGAVYMAEQEEPVRRRVALKIIKLGMDTKGVIARFEAERQALARMEHAGIAKVLDAGATESGRPYFVMELVRGIKITEYCDENHLPSRERLDLFIQVCHAIQHAHQKGIIHRDIKPSNILVSLHDGAPLPVIIDFGIAKATEQPLTDKTMFTAFEQFIGTPAYMSPEQAEFSRLDIDTRSDIYSLGVLLYELLTGKTPLASADLLAAGFESMRRKIREQEPLRPSTQLGRLLPEELTTAAKRRRTDPAKLVNLLKGDLDWIVMKCLEKDRARRYATANALALDVERHLHHRPVEARPPTVTYKVTKFVRRNKIVVSAAATAAAALVVGTLVSTWQAVRATQARHLAVAEAARAQQAEKKAAAAEQEAVVGREYQRGLAYAADMNLAQLALSQNNLGRAENLLNLHRPQSGEKDLRGWEWGYLWQQCRSDELVTVAREPGTMLALGASPDGRWLAAGDNGGGLTIHDLERRRELTRLATRGQPRPWSRVCLAFSPREPLLAYAVATDDGAGSGKFGVRFWNGTAQGAAEIPLTGECAGLAFSEDGQRLAAAISGGRSEVMVWSMPEKRKIASYEVPMLFRAFPSWPFAADRDLHRAVCCSGGAFHLVDLENGKTLWSREVPGIFVTFAFSPDGKTLASTTAYAETIVRRWDVATGTELTPLEGHRASVYALLFLPDGRRLVSGSSDQTIRIWDLDTARTLATLRGHQDEVWRLALLPNQTTLASAGKDGTVRLWDTKKLERAEPCSRLSVQVATWAFGADSSSVLTVDSPGNVERWQGDTFSERHALFEVPPGVVVNPFYGRLFSPDGRWLAANSTNGIVEVWDVQRGTRTHQLATGEDPVFPIAFLAQGARLVFAHPADFRLHLWDLARAREADSWPAVQRLSAVAFSPDERWCFMVGYRGDTKVRDMSARQEKVVDLSVGVTESAAYSPDNRLLTAATWSSVAPLWETATLRQAGVLGRFLLGAHSVAFSPDSARLAVTSGGKETVKLWSVESHQELLTLESQESRFVQSAFSPDGSVLGALSMEGHLHLWQARMPAQIEAEERKLTR